MAEIQNVPGLQNILRPAPRAALDVAAAPAPLWEVPPDNAWCDAPQKNGWAEQPSSSDWYDAPQNNGWCDRPSSSDWYDDPLKGSGGYDPPPSHGDEENPWRERGLRAAAAVSLMTPLGYLGPKPRATRPASPAPATLPQGRAPSRQNGAATLPRASAGRGQESLQAASMAGAPGSVRAWLRWGKAGAAAWAQWLGAAGRGAVWVGVGAALLAAAVCLRSASKNHRGA